MSKIFKQIVVLFDLRKKELTLHFLLFFIVGWALFLSVEVSSVYAIDASLDSVPLGKIVYFGGRRFVKMSNANSGVNYLWQASDEQQLTWDALTNSNNNVTADFYSNPGRIGYWLDNSYSNLLNASQPNASAWINSTNWMMGDETAENTTVSVGKINLPSYSDWNSYGNNYCLAVYGAQCNSAKLPYPFRLRTPASGSTSQMWEVDGGSIGKYGYPYDSNGVRPALNLKSGIQVCGMGDGSYDKPYFLGENNCTVTNQPPLPETGKLESHPAGTVVQMDNYKFIKMSDYLEPQRLDINGTTSNSYFVMADEYEKFAWDANNTNGCSNGVCGGNGGWTDPANTDHIKNTLNTTFYNSLSTDTRSIIIDTSWPVGGIGNYKSENNEFARNHISKVALISNREWLQHGADYCKGRQSKAVRNCNGVSFPANWWGRTADSNYSSYAWHVNSSSQLYNTFGSTSSIYGIRPALNLTTGISPFCGAGTYMDPFVLNEQNCSDSVKIVANSSSVDIYLNNTGVFNISGFVSGIRSMANQGRPLIVSATLNGITRRQVILATDSPIVDREFQLSWSAVELGDGFTLDGSINPIIITVADDNIPAAFATTNFTGSINVNFSRPQNQQPLSNLPSGSVVYFGGRRFVKISSMEANGESYLWQASDEQQMPWHAAVSGNNSNVVDFYSNPTKLGYWLTNTYTSLINVAQPGADSWIGDKNWTMGSYTNESEASVSGKVNLPSYGEWRRNKDDYCLTLYGVSCNNYYLYYKFWLRTPYSSTNSWLTAGYSSLTNSNTASTFSVRPALNLKASIQACSNGIGDGTYDNPYFLGDGDCSITNKPPVPEAGKMESYPAGTVIQMDNYKFVKMSDYLEPQRLDANGTTSNSYFMMADNYNYDYQETTNGCTGGNSGVCGGLGGWTDPGSVDHIKDVLNTTFYNSLSTGIQNMIIDTPWSIGGVGDYAAENNEFARNYTSKIALVSNREWLQHGINYCKAFGDYYNCYPYGGDYSPNRTPYSNSINYSWGRYYDGSLYPNEDLDWYGTYINPVLNLQPGLSPYCGGGTIDDPYMMNEDVCSSAIKIHLASPEVVIALNESGTFNLFGFVSGVNALEDRGRPLTVSATINGVTKKQEIPGDTLAIKNMEFLLSWTAVELGDGFSLDGASQPVAVTVTDNNSPPASATAFFSGSINVEYVNSSDQQPLSVLPSGSVVYFGGRRFVKISSNKVTGESYLWQANYEQQKPWHAIASGYNNGTADFYTNTVKPGYWLSHTYTDLLKLSQPDIENWISDTNWSMGDKYNELNSVLNSKIGLPSYSEWMMNKNNYCLGVYGENCGSSATLPYSSWLRTPYSNNSSSVLLANTSGNVGASSAYETFGILPALNLKSTIQVCGIGDGTYENPYFLADGNCDNTNQPTTPTPGKIESYPAGTVIQMDSYKFIKMSDYLEPQRLDANGNTSNSYFIMADHYNVGTSDPDNTNGCTGGNSGVCGGAGGWTDVANTNHVKSTLNTVFYNSLSSETKSIIADTAWPVGGAGNYAAENDEFVRSDVSKIALVSNREWLQHGADYCKGRQGKVDRNCKSGIFTSNWWSRTPTSSGTNGTWTISTSGYSNNGSSSNSKYGVRPALNLLPELSPFCGSGTYDDPYMMSSQQCSDVVKASISSPDANVYLNSNGTFNLSGEVTGISSMTNQGRPLTISATLNGITKTQVILGTGTTIKNRAFALSWSAVELGDGFSLNGSLSPLVVTVVDNNSPPDSATANFVGNINVVFANAQNQQPLSYIPNGSMVYFGGRRFVKISNRATGESYLWQASDEQEIPWHAVASGYNNTVSDFYSNSTKLGYWLTNTYGNLISVSQPTALDWISNTDWNMGSELAESADIVSGKINLPSYSEWISNKNSYCIATYGVLCEGNMRLHDSTWLRTPYSGSTTEPWTVSLNGTNAMSYNSTYTLGVRPALNLKASIQACSNGIGDGTYDNPYFLGDGDCSITNKPPVPEAGKMESYPAGTVIQMDNYKFVKMSDYLEPQRLDANGTTSNSYFMMADEFSRAAWNPSGFNGCVGGSSGVCGGAGGWTNPDSENHIKNILNNSFYNSLSINTKNMIVDTVWPVGGSGHYAAENNGFVRTDTSKIALLSDREWFQHADDYCKARYSRTNRYCTVNAFARSVWSRNSSSSNSNSAMYLSTEGVVITSVGVTGVYSVYPTLNLQSDLSPYCGSGTYADPYMMNAENCNILPFVAINSPTAVTVLNGNGTFNLSGFVNGANTILDIGRPLLVSATVNGITKTQAVSGSGGVAIKDKNFLLSWSAAELGDGFSLDGSTNPIVVTVVDDNSPPASASANFTGNISVSFSNSQNEQPLNTLPNGSMVYFGGRRFVKMDNQVTGESYLWQASDEQQYPWHAVASNYDNSVPDFYSNSTKLGYWLTGTYTDLLIASQSNADSWITSSNWAMGNENDESAISVTGKVALPSYSEWMVSKSNYCVAVYGAECDSNMTLPYSFWLRTPNSSDINTAWSLNTLSIFSSGDTYRTYGVRPALNLKSTIHACGSGDGSYSNPYFLGDGSCTTTNQPAVPITGTIESYPAGAVVQMGDYKFIKMADYLEPQRLNANGADSNNYFVMADQYNTSVWDPDTTNGCVGEISGVCGQPGGWTDITNTNHIKNVLNNTFYNSLNTDIQNMIVDTAWSVGGVGDHAAENDEFVRTDSSKIALISNREWLQHGADYCKSRQNKATRNCSDGSLSDSWWSRTPYSSNTGITWGLNNSGIIDYNYTDAADGVRPALNLVSEISPYCGSGTYADPYLLTVEACNTPPVITLDNATSDQQLSVSGNINFTGSMSDIDVGQQLNLNIKIMADDGITPLYSKDYPISPLSPVNQSWSISLNYLDLINLGERFNKVVFTLDDGIESSQAVYSGVITLESLQGKVDELYKLLGVNLAGQIYYPMNKKMDNVGDTYDGYTLLTNIDFSHQLWTQTLNAHPDMLSQTNQNNEQATPSSQVNTYLVKFFQPVQNLGTMSLSP